MNSNERYDRESGEDDDHALSNGTSPDGRGSSASHDIFLDPALAPGALSDPAFEFLKKHWLNLVYIVLAVVGITYALTTFKETFESDLRTSADNLLPVREGFQRYRAAREALQASMTSENSESGKTEKPAAKDSSEQQVEKEKERTRLREELEAARTALTQQILAAANESVDPYKQFGELYLTVLAREEGDMGSLSGKLNDARRWKDLDPDSIERLQNELLALNVARGMLDSKDHLAGARELLGELSEQGVYVPVSAARALADSAQSDSERASALVTLKSVRTRVPAQGAVLQESIERLEALLPPS